MITLPGEWTLVTGATSGIGYEMTKILASRGHNLVLVSRNEEKLCEVAREFNQESDIIIMPLDLSKPGSARIIYDECKRLGLNITTLINNAGFGKFGESWDLSFEDVESMLSLNIMALTSMSNLFARDMKAHRRGNILNVASTAAYLPIPYFSAYSASKTYVKNFTAALREELKAYGVNVTCLLPGPTHTRFADVAFIPGDREFFDLQMPMEATRVAEAGLQAMFRRQRSAVPGPVNKLVSVTAGLMPLAALSRLIRHFTSLAHT